MIPTDLSCASAPSRTLSSRKRLSIYNQAYREYNESDKSETGYRQLQKSLSFV